VFFSFATLRARLAMTGAFKYSILALAAVVLGLVALSGCGNSVPAGAVAKVGDSTITQDEFDKWMNIAVKGQSQAPGGAAAVPDPPDFEKCVAAKKKTPVPKGQQKPSDEALKKQCKNDYDTLKREVMQFLIQGEWVQQEADKRNIEVKPAELQKALEDQKKQVFPNDKQYQQFLKTSGMTEEDVLFRVKLNELQQRLTQDATQDAKKVSDEDISAYYEKNKQRFAQPERRDLRVVLTKTQAKAEQAKKELQSGESFKKVVKKYSIDEASKSQAGLLPAVSEGQQEKQFDAAIFAAPKDKLQGPVKTQFGYHVILLEDTKPVEAPSLDDVKPQLTQQVQQQNLRKQLDSLKASAKIEMAAASAPASAAPAAAPAPGAAPAPSAAPATSAAPAPAPAAPAPAKK